MSWRSLTVLGMILWMGTSCYGDADVYNERSAELECDFLNRCMAHQFRRTCQPCTLHEQCPFGSCDRRRGLCRDGRGHVASGQEQLNLPCTDAQECGSLVCRTHFESIATCEESVVSRLARREEKCAYNSNAGRECVRLKKGRSCGDELPEICKFVYDRCEN